SVVGAARADVLRAAAVILDEEMVVGISAAKAMQQRIAKEGKIDPVDFKEAMQRFQADAHDIISSLNGQLSGKRLSSNAEIAKQFVERANDMVDLTVGLVTTSAQLANDLIQTNFCAQSTLKRRRRAR